MLPGFRFLFAAITLAVSLLVFGLGAAALLRAAHEQFVNVHTVRPPSITLLARAPEGPTPSLSLLRVDPPASPAPASADHQPSAPAVADRPAAHEDDGTQKPAPTLVDPAQTAALQPPAADTPAPAPAPQTQTEQPSSTPELAPQSTSLPPQQPITVPGAAATAAAPAAPASAAQTVTTPIAPDVPKQNDNQKAEASDKPVAPAPPQAAAIDPAATAAAPATPPAAAPVANPTAELLPEVAPLTGPIPTPRRDPRERPKTAAIEQPAAPTSPTAVAPDDAGADLTGSLGEQPLPPLDATPLPVARPKPTARRPLKKRRQEARRRVPRTEQPQQQQPGSGFGL
ncbi:MAG: hypothetical protein QM576_11240 [Rhodopseudomonas sp.]|uniref:hypothetical protein n=1 Tax=Rhodopseudomonas sp. TaxID=1078 RepID=UPI0039E3CE40